MITILNKQRKITLNAERLLHSAQVVMKELGYENFDLSILLTNNKTIRTYNREYRKKDVPTDILSFPYYKLEPGQKIKAENEEDKVIGDIMISLEYVQGILTLYNVSLEERLDTLIIHGICHLLGYSHYDPENDAIMSKLEKKLAKKLKITDSGCSSEC